MVMKVTKEGVKKERRVMKIVKAVMNMEITKREEIFNK